MDLTALEYADERENVIVRYAGNGAPAGIDTAWIPPETELPFDLAEVEGYIEKDGSFTATNLKDGDGVWDWRFHDWNSNLIHSIWLRVDEEVWDEQYAELMGEE